MADATRVLHEWAIWCAEQVLHLFEKERPNDQRPRLALEAKRRWLDGDISDDELDAARAAAWAAARDVARDAARDAAWAAAWAAARAAARDAARAAAWAAAGDVARAAAWDAARDDLERRLLAALAAPAP
jgi:hypothetical protein